MLNRPDKDALRAMLEAQAQAQVQVQVQVQVQEKLQHDPDAITTYAAQSEPERKPYTTKPTVQEKAFHKELNQMRADAEAGVVHKPKQEPKDGGVSSISHAMKSITASRPWKSMLERDSECWTDKCFRACYHLTSV